jgi:hypothetical protein
MNRPASNAATSRRTLNPTTYAASERVTDSPDGGQIANSFDANDVMPFFCAFTRNQNVTPGAQPLSDVRERVVESTCS